MTRKGISEARFQEQRVLLFIYRCVVICDEKHVQKKGKKKEKNAGEMGEKSFPMTGGDGSNSYAKNSNRQVITYLLLFGFNLILYVFLKKNCFQIVGRSGSSCQSSID